jgi:effector-binding domain-containing protein
MAKNVNTATAPKIEYQAETHYMGIRKEVHFEGMFGKMGLAEKELKKWFKEHGIEASGGPFLRYHRIDMKGMMDMEFGIPVATPLEGTESIKAGIIPAGRYVSHIYTGGGLKGNQVLMKWILENNLPMDTWTSEEGDHFASRYEQYLTDPKARIIKTKIDILLAIKLKDE